ncbi:hypothetical protein AQJ30_16730 [Streptomyces longwoodensis]|uniref:Uncharacterized protein n=1 Tax=Streptomyces longwoodensis TaxID=68231 RepID=A0A101QWJ8_9ACTN|nr:hypothetical protein [Streptomyces longwoodensis]KUN37313.1 hypothetical protein AQJ30_16730 [Streptomyces longwoodensis]
MERRGHTLRLTAVAALVVLALTGFSTGRGHGSHHGGGGGGCSSSHQDHDGSSTGGGTSGSRYHDYDDDDDSYDSSSTGGSSGSSSQSAGTLRDADVELVDCATEAMPYATVRVTNPNDRGGYFTATVDFLDARSERLERRTAAEFVAAHDTVTVQVDLSGPGVAARVDHCLAVQHATAG